MLRGRWDGVNLQQTVHFNSLSNILQCSCRKAGIKQYTWLRHMHMFACKTNPDICFILVKIVLQIRLFDGQPQCSAKSHKLASVMEERFKKITYHWHICFSCNQTKMWWRLSKWLNKAPFFFLTLLLYFILKCFDDCCSWARWKRQKGYGSMAYNK